ncbi:hypothetical protein Dimus_033652 [Dionaea muscipula]
MIFKLLAFSCLSSHPRFVLLVSTVIGQSPLEQGSLIDKIDEELERRCDDYFDQQQPVKTSKLGDSTANQ